jgi:GNAT superfamily N-acetyltransferase
MYCNGELCGLSSAINFVHPKVKDTRKEHRTVILPDYQGVGLGVLLRNFVAEHYRKKGLSFITVTSNPALIHYMKRSNLWACTFYGRQGKQRGALTWLNNSAAVNRLTTSWKYVGTGFSPK